MNRQNDANWVNEDLTKNTLFSDEISFYFMVTVIPRKTGVAYALSTKAQCMELLGTICLIYLLFIAI